MSGQRQPHLPLAPLMVYADSGKHLALKVGMHLRQIDRWRKEGLTYYHADLAAVRLGLHPSHIWGDDWWAGTVLDPDKSEAVA